MVRRWARRCVWDDKRAYSLCVGHGPGRARRLSAQPGQGLSTCGQGLCKLYGAVRSSKPNATQAEIERPGTVCAGRRF